LWNNSFSIIIDLIEEARVGKRKIREKIVIPRELPKERAPHLPTKAHSTKKGKRGYNRKREKRNLQKDLNE